MRVLIVDDHPLFTSALVEVVRSNFSQHMVYSANSATQAATLAGSFRPDVVIADLHLPDISPERWIASLRDSSGAQCRIVMLSANTDAQARRHALEHGADAFLAKTLPMEALVSRLESWLGTRSAAVPIVPRPPITVDIPSDFSARQVAVASELVTGKSNKEIARALGLAPETVKTHVSDIIAKLATRNRTEAVLRLTGQRPT